MDVPFSSEFPADRHLGFSQFPSVINATQNIFKCKSSSTFLASYWLIDWFSLSRVRLFVTPWTVAYQASSFMGFYRQEYWSALPFPSPGDLPDPGISRIAGRCFNLWATREALASYYLFKIDSKSRNCLSKGRHVFGFTWRLSGKESSCQIGDTGLIPGLEISPRKGNGYPLQYSCLGNPIDREAWQATVHGVAKDNN